MVLVGALSACSYTAKLQRASGRIDRQMQRFPELAADSVLFYTDTVFAEAATATALVTIPEGEWNDGPAPVEDTETHGSGAPKILVHKQGNKLSVRATCPEKLQLLQAQYNVRTISSANKALIRENSKLRSDGAQWAEKYQQERDNNTALRRFKRKTVAGFSLLLAAVVAYAGWRAYRKFSVKELLS